jgi:hypothetical protein
VAAREIAESVGSVGNVGNVGNVIRTPDSYPKVSCGASGAPSGSRGRLKITIKMHHGVIKMYFTHPPEFSTLSKQGRQAFYTPGLIKNVYFSPADAESAGFGSHTSSFIHPEVCLACMD